MSENYEKRGYLLEEFRLFHLRDVQKTRIEPHYHEFCKVLLLLSGSGGYDVEGQRYLLRAGDVVLVGSRVVHRPEFDADSPYERVILYISPEFLRRASTPDCDLLACFSSTRGPVLRLQEQHRQRIWSLAVQLEQELSRACYGQIILSRGLVLHLLVELGRCQENVQRPEPVMPKNQRVLEILRYLDAHLTEELPIDALAEKFYLSKFHMMRLFREETGTSIHAYLTSRRLTRARELMEGGLSATQACFQSGFRSYSSFVRGYEKLFGQTPTGRSAENRQRTESYE